jgi:hypothetical protein
MFPLELVGPSSVTHIIADKVQVAGIHERRNARIQKIRDKRRKVLHPIGMKLEVDAHVAGLPARRLLTNVQRLLGALEIEEFVDMRKVITERGVSTFLGNVVRVQAGHLVGARQAHVANQKRTLARKVVQRAISLVTLLDQSRALGDNLEHGIVRFFRKDLNVMAVIVAHFRIILVLHSRIRKTVANGKAAQVEMNCAVELGLIAAPDAVSNLNKKSREC